MWNNFSIAARNLLIATLLSVGLWICFILAQQWNYKKTDQVYLIGTNATYGISFFFFLVLIMFLFSFIHHRYDAKKLKIRFFLFSIFYLIMGPLTLLSYDNYFSITQKGLQYNAFFSIEDPKVREWQEIKRVDLDYQQDEHKNVYEQKDIRLLFIVHYEDGESVDLNNYNSPLYRRDQFLKLYRVMKKNDIPIRVIRPLPKELNDPNSFLYELFSQKPAT
jgi:hypothetical protein